VSDPLSNPRSAQQIKVPPYSIEAEQSVLGGLLLDNLALDRIVEIVSSDDFYRKDHQTIYKAILALEAKGRPFDVVTLDEYLNSLGEAERSGGLVYLAELAKNTPSVANIHAYAEIIREHSVLRQLISTGSEIAELGFNPQGQNIGDILDAAEQKVFAIAESQAKASVGPESIKPLLNKTYKKLHELSQNQGKLTGISTGFKDLDKMTSGLQASDLVIIAGRPSMGKTVLAVNIAEAAALKQAHDNPEEKPKPILIFSLEMPADSLVMRMLSSLGGIEQNKIRTGALNEQDWSRVVSAIGLISEGPIFIDDSAALSPMEVRARARRLAKEHGQLGLILIDYLQLMQIPGRQENRTLEISEISRSLKALAKELKVPVVALSQLNRSLEQRPNKRPVMSDLRESGAIEQDADLIMFIYRDEVYNPDTEEKGKAELIIGKQRNGPIGTVNLTFQGQFTRFQNYISNQAIDPVFAQSLPPPSY